MSRKGFIGSSDIAAVMGLSRWETPLSLWAKKTGQIEEENLDDKEYIEWGKRLEDVVAKKFSEKNNVKLIAYKKRFQHKDYSYLTCELDRLIAGTDEIVEIKTANAFKTKEWDKDEIPQEYILQVMFALGLSKRNIGHLAVLIGGNKYLERKIIFDREMFSKMVKSAVTFMEKNVKNKIMPMAMSGDSDVLSELYPKQELPIIEGDDEANTLIKALQTTKKIIIDAEITKETLDAKLKEKLKEHEGMETAEYKVIWKEQKTSRINFQRLKDDNLYDKYAEIKSSRVLRINKKKEGK